MAYTTYTAGRQFAELTQTATQPGVLLLVVLALACVMFGLADPEQFAALALLS